MTLSDILKSKGTTVHTTGPDVLLDEVVAEFELAWADRKVAVLVNVETEVEFPDHQDWKFISSLEIESNLNSLKVLLEVDYG